MKKCLTLILALLLPLCAQAAGLPQLGGSGLPQLDVVDEPSGVLPDPQELLGAAEKVFATDYPYTPDFICTVYTYDAVAEDVVALYKQQALAAGYAAEMVDVEGYRVMKLTYKEKSALYFPNYGGVTMLMVQNGLAFKEPAMEGCYLTFTRNGRKITTGPNADIAVADGDGLFGIGKTFEITYDFKQEPITHFSLAFPDWVAQGDEFKMTHKKLEKCVYLYTAQDEYLVFYEDDYGDAMETSRDFFNLKITKVVKNNGRIQIEGTFEGAFNNGETTFENGSFRVETYR